MEPNPIYNHLGNMAEEIDFSDLPTNDTRVVVLAGALAGILEHSVMYPVDSVKTRVQLFKSSNPKMSIRYALKSMIKNEGFASPYRGIGAVLLGTGPVHSLYFGSYEFSKRNIPKLSPALHDSKLLYACAGIIATVVHDFLLNPIEVVKQRLQMDNQKYKGIAHCVKCVSKSEGFSAFYRSYSTQLLMNIPYNSVNFVTYETVRKFLYGTNHASSNSKAPFDPKVHLIAGSCSGSLAAALTIPFDVIKTQLNTQRVNGGPNTVSCCHCTSTVSGGYFSAPQKFSADCNHSSISSSLIAATKTRHLTSTEQVPLKGMSDAAFYIYKNGGVKGFFRGTVARVIYNTPACAICWSVYEFFKHFLQT